MGNIVLNEIDKVYDNGFHAVHKLSLDVADGEFLVLVGPSGCGKSTALRMIAGLESITSGELRIGGKVVNDLEPKDRDIAMVFQSYALYPHLTVRDNIAFALKLKKMPKDEINERVDKAAKILELTENLDRKPGQLSGGQRQRVAMGRAIVRQPQAFLMDEPLSNLDAKLRVQMRAEVSKLQHTLNVTTVYVTHDQIEAMTMGDRVAVLSRGVLQQVGTPQDLYDHPDNLFVGAFIGSPQMNLLEATVSSNGGGTTLKFGSSTLTVPASVLAAAPSLAGYDGRRVAVGIRPEHMTVGVDGAPDTISGSVDVREGLGSEVILHVTTDAVGVDTSAAENTAATSDRVVVARVEPHATAQPGERATPRRRHDQPSRVRSRDRPRARLTTLTAGTAAALRQGPSHTATSGPIETASVLIGRGAIGAAATGTDLVGDRRHEDSEALHEIGWERALVVGHVEDHDDLTAPVHHEIGVVRDEQLETGQREIRGRPPHGNRPPVEREHRARIGLFAGRVPLRPLLGLGQPRLRRAARREPERRGGVVGPRQWHPTAVAADLEAAGAGEDRVLTGLVREIEHLGEAELLAGVQIHAAGQTELEQCRGAGARRVPTSMSTGAWEFSSALPMAAPCVTASARPNRVTDRWASWLFSVHAGSRPAGISASTVERTALRNASAFHGASIRSNANDWWNSSSLAY